MKPRIIEQIEGIVERNGTTNIAHIVVPEPWVVDVVKVTHVVSEVADHLRAENGILKARIQEHEVMIAELTQKETAFRKEIEEENTVTNHLKSQNDELKVHIREMEVRNNELEAGMHDQEIKIAELTQGEMTLKHEIEDLRAHTMKQKIENK
jgi:predicted RNase H-like nuclease (RuvC/YqgF family)